MRKFLLVALAVAACAAALHVGNAQALAACGTISASTTLTADCAAPLTVVAGGITVDLGGHSVVCDAPAPQGIFVDLAVSNTTVKNGTVRPGLSNCVEGVNVEGHFNRVTSVRASGAGEGFVVGGDSNTLLLITSSSNSIDGVGVFGVNNTVRQATLTENLNGVDFILGLHNTITRSRIFFNDTGISVDGAAMDIDQNHVFSNNTGIYLSGASQHSAVVLNQTYLNEVGIRIDTLSGGHNTVFLNGSYANDNWDMEDDNASCDSNFWFNNVFGTANQGCIH